MSIEKALSALSRAYSDKGKRERGGTPPRRGPYGVEYTDHYGRRLYQSDIKGVPPVVMNRDYPMPEGHFQQPDFYLDPTQQYEYARYRRDLAAQEGSDSGVAFYSKLMKDIEQARALQLQALIRRYAKQ